jgi:hypothetical protein
MAVRQHTARMHLKKRDCQLACDFQPHKKSKLRAVLSRGTALLINRFVYGSGLPKHTHGLGMPIPSCLP